MTRSTVTGGGGRGSTFTANNLNEPPTIWPIASAATGIVWVEASGGPSIWRRNGLRSGTWSSTDISPLADTDEEWRSWPAYDAVSVGARPDRIRIAWQPNLDHIRGTPFGTGYLGSDFNVVSHVVGSGTTDLRGNSHFDYYGFATIPPVNQASGFFRGTDRETVTLIDGNGFHNIYDGNIIWVAERPVGILDFLSPSGSTQHVEFPDNFNGNFRAWVPTTGATARETSQLFSLHTLNNGEVRLVNSSGDRINIGQAGTPRHADGITTGHSTAPQTVYVAYGTAGGITIRSVAPASTVVDENLTVPWPPGLDLTDLRGLFLTYFRIDNSIGIVGMWGTETSFDLRVHVYHPNVNQIDPLGWATAATETFGVFTPEIWLDRYPHDKTVRLIANTATETYCWEHVVNAPPLQPLIVTAGGQLPITATGNLDWVFNDTDFLDAQSSYQIRRVVNQGTAEYWLGGTQWAPTPSSATKLAGSTTFANNVLPTVPASRIGEIVDLSVRLWDIADDVSPWANPIRIIRSGVPLQATITSPNNNSTITNLPLTVTWQARNGQGSYELTTTNLNTGETTDNGGRIYTTGNQAELILPTDSTYRIRLKLWTTDGVTDDQLDDTVTVSTILARPGIVQLRTAITYDPAAPNITLNYFSTNANPNNLNLEEVRLWRRPAGTSGNGIRVARNLSIPQNWATGEDWVEYTAAHQHNYDYRPELVAEYVSQFGAWTRINNLVED